MLEDVVQFIVVIGIFILVIGATYITTKILASFQKKQGSSRNIEVIETYRLTTNKYLQIVKVANQYMVIAVCKDTVTFLMKLSDEDGESLDRYSPEPIDFKAIFEKAKNMTLKK